MKKEAALENMGWLEASLLLKSYHPITMYEWPWLEPFNCFNVFVAYVCLCILCILCWVVQGIKEF